MSLRPKLAFQKPQETSLSSQAFFWKSVQMAKNAEISKQDKNEEEEMGEKQEEDGACWFIIIYLTIVDIYCLNKSVL